MKIQSVDIPERKTDIYRKMQPGDSIEVKERQRQSVYNSAKLTVPAATWKTVKIDGKVYLNRVS